MSNSQKTPAGYPAPSSPSASGRTVATTATVHQHTGLSEGTEGDSTGEAVQSEGPSDVTGAAQLYSEATSGTSGTRSPIAEIRDSEQKIQSHQYRPFTSSSSSSSAVGVHRSPSPKDSKCAQLTKSDKSSSTECMDRSNNASLSESRGRTLTTAEQSVSRPAMAVNIPVVKEERLLKLGGELGAKAKTTQSLPQSSSEPKTAKSGTTASSSKHSVESESKVATPFAAELDTLSGYEQVSKTILRKTDVIAKVSVEQGAKSKTTKGENVESKHVKFQVEEGSSSPLSKERKEHKTSSSAGKVSSHDISPSKTGKQSKDSSVSPRCETSMIPAENETCNGNVSPTHPIIERLTNTVIRRHVKGKTPGPADSRNRSLAVSGNDTITPAEDSRQDQPLESSLEESKLTEKAFKEKPLGEERLPSVTLVGDSVTFCKKGQSVSSESAQVQVFPRSKTVNVSSSVAEINVCGSQTVPKKRHIVEKHGPIRKAKFEEKDTALSRGPQEAEIALITKAPSPETKHVTISDSPEASSSKVGEKLVRKSVFKLLCKFREKPRGTVTAECENSSFEEQMSMPEELASTSGEGVVKQESEGQENGSCRAKRKSKSCCFCWCCCCSCSCHKRNEEARLQRRIVEYLENYFRGEDQIPSLEEVRAWGESFDKLMKCSAGRKLFREFLKCEYSEENILFWLACEDLKLETKQEVIEERARIIYEDFVSILSPREVSLDSRVREEINGNMANPTLNTFDEAQLQIYTLMHRDSYPRFVMSSLYREVAHLPAPVRRDSVV